MKNEHRLEPLGPPLSAADAAWLKMAEPTNPMTITSALLFDTLPSWEALRAFVARVVSSNVRLRQRVVWKGSVLPVPHWQEVSSFNLDDHLFRAALSTGDAREIRERISALMSTPLEHTRPLWEMHMLEGPSGRGALIARIQHSIGDGVSLVKLLESMASEAGDAPPRPAPRRRDSLWRVAGKAAKLALRPRSLAMLAREAAAGTGSLGKTVLLPPDPSTVLKRPLTVQKRCAWSAPIPVPRLKAIAASSDGTVNDVLMAAIAGALRRYLIERGEPVDAGIRTLLTVNLRPPESTPELGNRFGLVYLPLPIAEPSPRERLLTVKRRMDAIKASREAPMILYLLGATGAVAPPELEHELVDFFGKKASLVVTNLRGPEAPVTFAGKKVSELLVWAPLSARLGLGVSLLSYAGNLTAGIASDAGVIPEPDLIATGIELELAALERQATVPGPEPKAGADDAARAPDVRAPH